MKILFLHRSKSFGGFSFETLFETIKEHLTTCQTEDFYDKTYSSFWKNLKEIRRIKCDVIHITGGIGYYAFFLPTHKTMLTVHDTNHYEFDLKGFKKWIFGYLFYKLPIANVKYVTVVSEHTKSRLIKLFGIPEYKICVIHNCYSNNFEGNVRKELNSPVKILQIGTKANKNIPRLINAIKGLNVELSIIGKLNEKLIEQLKKQDIKYLNKINLSNSEIYNEYKKCDIVAFVSLREGFGLPIIEANAVGRAVITSNISSMPEVAANAACIIDPTSEKEIREGIQKIIKDTTYRNQLITNGFENIKRFNPTLIAKKYETLYLKLITEK
ncbi:MAG: glycosyltransferase family 4 protein [Flavobacteriales bacterium]|nr:glycosyltransferase family 4 protein [Flavobacteriales bacterium]